jgi:hypothetical protein
MIGVLMGGGVIEDDPNVAPAGLLHRPGGRSRASLLPQAAGWCNNEQSDCHLSVRL